MPSASRLIPPLFVLLWATGFIGARYTMPYAEPFVFLVARCTLAALPIGAILLLRRRPALSRRAAFDAAVAGILMHGVYLGGVFWAVHRGMPAGISALVVGLQPPLTALMAGALLGEKLTRKLWAGLAVGFAGVVIVLWPKLGIAGEGIDAATLTAVAIAVAAMSAGTIWQKHRAIGEDLLAGTFWQYVGAAVVLSIASLLFEDGHFEPTGELIFGLAWLVLVLSLGAIFLLMVMIREGEMSRVATLFYLVPAATAVMAWLLFDETLTAAQMGGIALTALGVRIATAARLYPVTRARASR